MLYCRYQLTQQVPKGKEADAKQRLEDIFYPVDCISHFLNLGFNIVSIVMFANHLSGPHHDSDHVLHPQCMQLIIGRCVEQTNRILGYMSGVLWSWFHSK